MWYGRLPHFGKEYSLERFRRFEVLCRCIEAGKYPHEDTSVSGYGPAQRMSDHVRRVAAQVSARGGGASTFAFRRRNILAAEVRVDDHATAVLRPRMFRL